MRFLRQLFRPSHGLMLLWDYNHQIEASCFFESLEEVGRYYRLVSLRSFQDALRHGSVGSLVHLTISHARKAFFAEVLPELIARDVPFTVFLDARNLGITKLPWREELAAFRAGYGEKIDRFLGAEEAERLAWECPAELEERFGAMRKKFGPLPTDKIYPEDLFAHWSDLYKVPEPLWEPGISITHRPTLAQLRSDIDLLEKRLGRRARVAHCQRAVEENILWSELGIESVLVPKIGKILKGSDPLSLAHWPLEN